MNRPGQAPQRPPALPTQQQMGGPFRTPYPQQQYGIPPRGVLPTYPMPNHRTQNMVPGPPFIQSRGAGPFPFGGSLQHQHPTSLHPHQQPPHPLNSNSSAPAGTSASSASEAALDPNDFPALGSAGTTVTASTVGSSSTSTTNTAQSSYASQAGTNPTVGTTPSTGGNSATQQQPTRDFGPDDFPALGGQSLNSSVQETNHPPGLNGFQNGEQHRQNVLGSMQQSVLQNMASGQRQHFQTDTDKPNYAIKLGPNNHTAPGVAWTQQQNAAVGNAGGFSQNGAPSQQHLLPSQPQSQQQQQHLSPGLPPPNYPQSQHLSSQQQFQNSSNLIQQPSSSSQLLQQVSNPSDPPLPPPSQPQSVPQTPAQQILMSAADRWGLLGLLAMIKNGDPDQTLLSVGTDLGTMGLDMNNNGNLYSSFITPWSDSSAAHVVEPDFHIPGCYAVPVPPPSAGKAAAFSDETLFFMFYSSPRDALQEIAAQELFNRNWRFHKEMCIWLTREAGNDTANGGSQGLSGELSTYSYWDPENWEKVKKDMVIDYNDLEDRSSVTTGVTANSTQLFQQQQQQSQNPSQVGVQQRGFQAMGLAM